MKLSDLGKMSKNKMKLQISSCTKLTKKICKLKQFVHKIYLLV